MGSEAAAGVETVRYDVIVIGGGAAGLLAAGEASALGARTLLLEKMNRPGRKLSITGKGRCNLTNSAPMEEFLRHFGLNGRFLKPSFFAFFSKDLIRLLDAQGVTTVTERGGRVFPRERSAVEVAAALIGWVREQGGVLINNAPVEKLLLSDGRIDGVEVATADVAHGSDNAMQSSARSLRKHLRRRYYATAVILATGGASYPCTGSSGDGYRLAAGVGHTIVPIRPALTPLETAGDVVRRLQGLSLKNVSVSLWVDGKKNAGEFGEMIFTHFGLSGPVILTLSRRAVEALNRGARTEISIDLKPALDDRKLDERLLRDIAEHGTQRVSNLLKGMLPRTLIPVCVEATGIDGDKIARQITTAERKRLRLWLKEFRFEVTRYRPWSEAIITTGGIQIGEVDPVSMESRLVQGLYFAGEVLDIDADTGGYNLQAAFSTGWLAGHTAGMRHCASAGCLADTSGRGRSNSAFP